MEQEYDFQKEYDEAMKSIADCEKEIADHNNSLINSLGETASEDFQKLLDFVYVTDKIEFVNEPKGDHQSEDDCGIFTNIHVDQWCVNMDGDSFDGFIYAQIPDGRCLKIPYHC